MHPALRFAYTGLSLFATYGGLDFAKKMNFDAFAPVSTQK